MERKSYNVTATIKRKIEPSREIMVLFVLRKLVLQTCMRSHPVGIDVWFLAVPFIYFLTSCVRTAKALVRLGGCAGSPEPSLVAYVISTIISWAGSIGHPKKLMQLSWNFNAVAIVLTKTNASNTCRQSKQCRPYSDCSFRSKLCWPRPVCLKTYDHYGIDWCFENID